MKNNKVSVSYYCLGLDRSNAQAMINGYIKDGKIIHQAIYCVVAPKPPLMLIAYFKSPSKFKLGELGRNLNYPNLPIKYIAKIEQEYFIKNDIALWEKLCSNGLFDIWEPESPFKRFNDVGAPKTEHRILLLRIYEITEEFQEEDIYRGNPHSPSITYSENLEVTIKRPVIDDETFIKTKQLLEKSLKGFIQNI